MDHTFKLPPRLAAIAALVPDGARLADVGTDHALLPIRLLLDGKIQSAVATDIRPGPLSRAKENACAAGVQDLFCVLCDGLTGISPDSVDTVVIAGMGGENIAAILRAAPWACRNALCILQPMSRPEELRAALPSLGLMIRAERLVRDAGRLILFSPCAPVLRRLFRQESCIAGSIRWSRTTRCSPMSSRNRTNGSISPFAVWNAPDGRATVRG